MFYFHPYLGKIPNLTNIFQLGWNHQLDTMLKRLFFEGFFHESTNQLQEDERFVKEMVRAIEEQFGCPRKLVKG